MNPTSNYRGAVVVIPTRNRAHLAINAIRSVIEEPVDPWILASDNSADESERQQLETFCTKLGHPRLCYLRPPQSLPMPAHWQWALEQALANEDASHFIYLTDRMMFKNGALIELLDLAAVYPDKVISYNHDRIRDHTRPIRFEEYEVTAKLLEVDSERLLWLTSEAILHHGLPRMLNCLVPRRVLEQIGERFGNVFSSIAPDFNFCFRCLDLEPSILFYDKSPLFHYALDRSLGASGSRGESTPELDDFAANLAVDSLNRNYATPIPSLITATNAVFNEYLIYKRETQSTRFPEVNLQNYLRANAVEVTDVTDPQLRARTEALLVQHGYREEIGERTARRRLHSLIRKLKSRGKKTPAVSPREFASLEEAIHYARTISRGSLSSWTWGADVLHGRELPVGTTLG